MQKRLGSKNLKLQPTSYSLWWAVSASTAIYLPIKEEDCYCLDENLKNQKPVSLLEKSMFFLHKEEFAESKTPTEPILKEWRGTVPSCSPFRHILRLTKLTGWEGKDKEGKPIIPFKLKGMSHELHSLYHPKRDASRLRLLFRIQIGAPEQVAIQLALKVATEIKSLPTNQGYLLLRPKLESYKLDRWGEFISTQLDGLLNQGKQL
jgi:hypothetical protein